MPGNCTDDQAVENQEKYTAQPKHQASGKGLEGDTDVMHDVVAKHHPVFARCTFRCAPQAAGIGVVHALHLGNLLRADDAVDKVGKQVDQQAYADQAAEKQQAGDQHEPPLFAHQPREIGQYETQHIGGQLAAMAVQLLMAAQGQLLQWVYQVTAIAAFLSQGEVLAQAPVLMGEIGNVTGFDLALLQLLEQIGECLPGVVLVTPNEVDKAALEALRQKLAEMPKVQQAQLDLVWVERLAAILKLGDRFVFGLTVLLVSALLLVIGNTIRLHIENCRTEIEVIKLVGGTDSYVRRPFLYMGALYGFGAGILSWGVLAFGLDWLNDAVIGLAGLYGSDFALAGVPVADGLSLLLGAVLLGYIGAWIAVARHLRELAPK